jgi:hypothetical protein
VTVTEPVCPFGPVTVVCDPVSVRVVVRVAVLPLNPVMVDVVPVAERMTRRLAVLPSGPVVLELTSPAVRFTLRVADWPLAPVTEVLRPRARASPVTQNNAAALASDRIRVRPANELGMVVKWIVFMRMSFQVVLHGCSKEPTNLLVRRLDWMCHGADCHLHCVTNCDKIAIDMSQADTHSRPNAEEYLWKIRGQPSYYLHKQL